MKSRTSFFNFTILKKDITRYFPVWGLYSVLLVLYYIGNTGYYAAEANRMLGYLDDIQAGLPVLNVIYAGICAMTLFGDLYKSRLCNALHAMPIRRESWFLSHTVAAILFCAVPNAVYAMFIAPLLGSFWYLAFVLLGVSVLQFIAFFGIAAFAAMCAGTRFGMAAAYMAINFWSALVMAFATYFIYPLMYGVRISGTFLENASPFAYAMDQQYLDIYTTYYMDAVTSFRGYSDGFIKLAILTVAGIALLGAALLLYRRRKLETAGDFMANRPAAAVFQVLICLLAGIIFKATTENYIVGFFGVTVGFFAGSMLLQRKVNVFKKRNFVLWGVVMATLTLALLGARFDPLGLTERVPKASAVKHVQVSDEYGMFMLTGDNAEDIELILQMHQKVVEEKPETQSYNNLVFEYTLAGGRKMTRAYPISIIDLDQEALETYYSNWRRVFGTEDWEQLVQNLTYVRLFTHIDDRDMVFTYNVDDYNWDATAMLENPVIYDDVVELFEIMKAESGKVMPLVDRLEDYYYIVNFEAQIGDETIHKTLMFSKEAVQSISKVEELFEKYYTTAADAS